MEMSKIYKYLISWFFVLNRNIAAALIITAWIQPALCDDLLDLDLGSMSNSPAVSHGESEHADDTHPDDSHGDHSTHSSNDAHHANENHEEPENHDQHDSGHVAPHPPGSSGDVARDMKLLNINGLKSPGPISEKVLTNENVSLPIKENKTILEMARFWENLSTAQQLREKGRLQDAKTYCIQILENPSPDEINRLALLELSYVLEEMDEKLAANQVLAQYIVNFNKAGNLPEVYLRQGKILKDLGSMDLAIGKYYAAMNSTINQEAGDDERYRRIALLAQTEIGDTYYDSGRFPEAITTYTRILKDAAPGLNVDVLQYKLIKAMLPVEKANKILSAARKFLRDFPSNKKAPEIHFIVAAKLNELGQDGEAMESVLQLLKARPGDFETPLADLIPWQQKSGNLLANALYEKGDYMAARSLYESLIRMDADPQWVIPATYQFAQCSEKLDLPADATDAYMKVLALAKNVPSDSRGKKPLQIRTLVDMAQFRLDQLIWLSESRDRGRSLLDPSAPPAKTQKVDDKHNLKWLGNVYQRMDDKTAAKILSRMDANDITGILGTMAATRQGSILRHISSQGPKEKSLAGAVASALELPKQLADIPVETP